MAAARRPAPARGRGPRGGSAGRAAGRGAPLPATPNIADAHIQCIWFLLSPPVVAMHYYGAPSLCWPVLEAYVAGQYLGEKLTYQKFETGFIKKPDDQESTPLVKII